MLFKLFFLLQTFFQNCYIDRIVRASILNNTTRKKNRVQFLKKTKKLFDPDFITFLI